MGTSLLVNLTTCCLFGRLTTLNMTARNVPATITQTRLKHGVPRKSENHCCRNRFRSWGNSRKHDLSLVWLRKPGNIPLYIENNLIYIHAYCSNPATSQDQ